MLKSEETRARILAAATRLIAKKGPSSTRTVDLAYEAGVSQGAIFRYFPTKTHIVEEVLKGLFTRFTTGLQHILNNNSSLSERDVLEKIIDYHFSFFREEENLALIIMILTEQEGFDKKIMGRTRNAFKPYVTRVAMLIERGMGKGLFKPGNPAVAAMAFFGLMHMAILNKLVNGANYSFDEVRAEVKKIYFTGIDQIIC